MSDFYFSVGVLRDDLAEALADDNEQSAYVLAHFADTVSPGSGRFDDFMDMAQSLDDDEKSALLAFCAAVSSGLGDNQ